MQRRQIPAHSTSKLIKPSHTHISKRHTAVKTKTTAVKTKTAAVKTKPATKAKKTPKAQVVPVPIFPIDPNYDPSQSLFEWVNNQHGSEAEAIIGTDNRPLLDSTWLASQIRPITPQPSQAHTDYFSDGEDPPEVIQQQYHVHPNLRIINTSWQVLFDTSTLSLYQSFLSSRIPTAHHLDLESASMSTSYKPLAFSSVSQYATLLSKLGIDDSSSILLYDYNGLLGAAYAHWLLSAIGVKPTHIRILSGGWQKWIQDKTSYISSGPILPPQPSKFQPDPAQESFHHILDNEMFDLGYAHHITLTNGYIDHRLPVIIDTRSPMRFTGAMREPTSHGGIRGGHIPGSINIPYANFVTLSEAGVGTVLKSNDDLQDVFANHFINLPKDTSAPFIVTSGTGTTASVARLALMSLGYTNIRLYSSSWFVYGYPAAYPTHPRPIEVGESAYSKILQQNESLAEKKANVQPQPAKDKKQLETHPRLALQSKSQQVVQEEKEFQEDVLLQEQIKQLQQELQEFELLHQQQQEQDKLEMLNNIQHDNDHDIASPPSIAVLITTTEEMVIEKGTKTNTETQTETEPTKQQAKQIRNQTKPEGETETKSETETTETQNIETNAKTETTMETTTETGTEPKNNN